MITRPLLVITVGETDVKLQCSPEICIILYIKLYINFTTSEKKKKKWPDFCFWPGWNNRDQTYHLSSSEWQVSKICEKIWQHKNDPWEKWNIWFESYNYPASSMERVTSLQHSEDKSQWILAAMNWGDEDGNRRRPRCLACKWQSDWMKRVSGEIGERERKTERGREGESSVHLHICEGPTSFQLSADQLTQFNIGKRSTKRSKVKDPRAPTMLGIVYSSNGMSEETQNPLWIW